MRRYPPFLVLLLLTAHATTAGAQTRTLIVDGGTETHDGEQRYDHICVINGGTLRVRRYTGGDKRARGNVELLAGSVYVDASSKLDAHARGYQAGQCSDGDGPTENAGGKGGCSVYDSGGGGAHFGGGGRGTVDLQSNGAGGFFLYDPVSFEDDCDHDFSPNAGGGTHNTGPGGTCPVTTQACGTDIRPNCPDGRGGSQDARFCRVGPTVAGEAYWHNIYEPDFGAAGGDKGCLDGDGRSSGDPIVGGDGGGRIVVAGLSHLGDGSSSPCGVNLAPGHVQIDGTIEASGGRGCGHGNDSGGGGAGGTVLVVGEQVAIGATATLSVAGGTGGDTLAKNNDPYGDCPANSQNPPAPEDAAAKCDDCGGGGGGGIISVLSVTANIDPAAEFDVSGASGGTCPVCEGEAGGGAGELQLDGAYVGEFCDGYDNDFDGNIDEGLGSADCGFGACQASLDACTAGVPTSCMPMTGAGCDSPIDGARPRMAIVLDTSASMLLDLSGNPTFGDGSVEHPGLDTDGAGGPNDSRLFFAREAVAQVVSSYPEVDFSLARYHQDQAINRACQTATWFECQDLVASYDDPTDNTGNIACTKSWLTNNGQGPANALGNVQIRVEPSPGDDEECINYAGSCGPPRRAADVLSGFGSSVSDLVRWLDGRETNFIADATPGNVCDHAGGGDCELRGTGPTPLAGSLQAIEDYMVPFRDTDPAVLCRGYDVILVTDGAESCNGDPVAAAQQLHDVRGIDVNVIAVSVLPEELVLLNGIASAGGTGNAVPVDSAQALITAITNIIADSIRYETCNNTDDDCDGLIDEGFDGLGDGCDDGALGVCLSTGSYVCNGAGDGIECNLSMPGNAPSAEICNELDDNCNGTIDEGMLCINVDCVPTGDEVCDGDDDDCDGRVDEDPLGEGNLCGQSAGNCAPGRIRCVQGMPQCIGATMPMDEICDGEDNDCDGDIDNDAPCPGDGACFLGACRRSCNPGDEFPCPFGQKCEMPEGVDGTFCIPDACAACSPDERCEDDVCIDLCDDVSCEAGQTCQQGACLDCHSLGCEDGEICVASQCKADACADVECEDGQLCSAGECAAVCVDSECPDGEHCGDEGACEADPCEDSDCRPFEVCLAGDCVIDVCANMGCPAGDVCLPSMGCTDDPCAEVDCPQGRDCRATKSGRAECGLTAGIGGGGGDGDSGGSAGDGDSGGSQDESTKTYISPGGSGVFGCSVGRRGPGQPDSRGSRSSTPWLLAAGLCLLGLRRRRLL